MATWAGSTVCKTFKKELLEGAHNFALDTFRLALYTSQAILDENTSSYTTLGELLSLNGYLAGGRVITIDAPLLVNSTAIVPFENVVWQPASFKARGALCYNASKGGLPAVFVLDFGTERESNGTNFVVQFPAGETSAIVRIF